MPAPKTLVVAAVAACSVLASVVAAPGAAAATGRHALAAHVSEVGTATAGRPVTLALRSANAGHYTPSFGDGSKAVRGTRGPATRVRHTYAHAGWHTVTLTVSAARQKSVTAREKLLVLSPASRRPRP